MCVHLSISISIICIYYIYIYLYIYIYIYDRYRYLLSTLENADENRIFFVRSPHHKHFGKARGGTEINGEDVYKMGSYSFKSLKNNQNKKDDANRIQQGKGIACYNCGNTISGQITKHKSNCPARNSKCYKCKRMGHFGNVCQSKAEIKKVDEDRQMPNDDMKDIEDKI